MRYVAFFSKLSKCVFRLGTSDCSKTELSFPLLSGTIKELQNIFSNHSLLNIEHRTVAVNGDHDSCSLFFDQPRLLPFDQHHLLPFDQHRWLPFDQPHSQKNDAIHTVIISPLKEWETAHISFRMVNLVSIITTTEKHREARSGYLIYRNSH